MANEIEKTGLLKFKGEDGQIYVLYPQTTVEQIEGLEDFLSKLMGGTLSGKYAPLDASGKVALDYLYTNAANALAKLDANGKLPTDLIPTLSAYIAATAKGAANGVATLGANGKLPSAQLTSHSHAYSDITGKPSTFAPSAHSHAASEITGLETYLAEVGYGKVTTGTYTGDGTTGRTITLPFSPSVVVIHAAKLSISVSQGGSIYLYSGSTTKLVASLSEDTLTINAGSYQFASGLSSCVSFNVNQSSQTYLWMAFE